MIKSGQHVRFRLKGERHFNIEKITSLEDGLVFLETTIIKINQIDAIDIRDYKKSTFDLNSYSVVLPNTGMAYMSIDQFNQVVVDGREFGISDDVLKVSGVLVITGN